MEDWKKISEFEIERISEKYKVDSFIIKRVVTEWYIYHYMGKRTEEFFKDEPTESDIKDRSNDLATASLFYYNHKDLIEDESQDIFEKVVFYPLKSDSDPLRFSQHFANTILKSFLIDFNKKGYLINENMAKEILKKPDRIGKGPEIAKANRNNMIKAAASFLKDKKVRCYAAVLSDLLFAMNIEEISPGAIRLIVKRSQQ